MGSESGLFGPRDESGRIQKPGLVKFYVVEMNIINVNTEARTNNIKSRTTTYVKMKFWRGSIIADYYEDTG